MKPDRLNAIAAAQIALLHDREAFRTFATSSPRLRAAIARSAQGERRALRDLGGMPA